VDNLGIQLKFYTCHCVGKLLAVSSSSNYVVLDLKLTAFMIPVDIFFFRLFSILDEDNE
jgi:hypothetical protein